MNAGLPEVTVNVSSSDNILNSSFVAPSDSLPDLHICSDMNSSSSVDTTINVDTMYSSSSNSSSTPESINLSETNPNPAAEKPKLSENREKYKPNTPEWTLQRIVEDQMPKAVGILSAWMPLCRSREATEDTVVTLRKLTQKNALNALDELKKRHKYIKGTKGKDMKLSATFESLASGAQMSAIGLVDSGATGTCINREYVLEHGLETRKLPIKIPVYNADGTLNDGGAIEEVVELRLIIGDHAERIEMAVVNLGKTDFFLGLDWLRLHNPSIDWDQSTVIFDRCPERCGYIPFYESPEEEIRSSNEKLKDGDHIFWMDWDSYLKANI